MIRDVLMLLKYLRRRHSPLVVGLVTFLLPMAWVLRAGIKRP